MRKVLIRVIVLLALLSLTILILDVPKLRSIVFSSLGYSPEIYTGTSFLNLTFSHFLLVLAAEIPAIIIAVSIACFVTRKAGKPFLSLAYSLGTLAQTFPPIAILALAVPLLGFGFKATIFALFLYGLLPILHNGISGLQAISPSLTETAEGLGLSGFDRLLKVELPLALPVLIAGIRTSTIFNLGTAAIGSTIGAKSLGEPIIAGIQTGTTAFIIQGALILSLLALLIDQLFNILENKFSQRKEIELSPKKV